MARERHQNGWVKISGKTVKKWIGHWRPYREDGTRSHSTVVLGLKAKMAKWEAEDALRKHIEKETRQAAALPAGTDPTFQWFWENRFTPTRVWSPHTADTVNACFAHHVLPVLGQKRLADINKFSIDMLLQNVARSWSKSIVHKIRTYLKASLEDAIDQDLLSRNPARKIINPQTRPTCNRYLSMEEIAALLAAMEGRDRLIARICILLGLRPGELFACRWDDFDAAAGRLRIDEAAVDGAGIKDTKTPGSRAWVWMPASLTSELRAWQALAPQAIGYIFPSSTGTPIRTQNFLRRHLWPAAIRAGIMQAKPEDWPAGKRWTDPATAVNFRAFRRTCATWFQKVGTTKDIQAHLRHATPMTTLGVYVQEIPESVRAAVEALDRNLNLPAKTKDRVQ